MRVVVSLRWFQARTRPAVYCSSNVCVISVCRISNIGKLSVQQLSSPELSDPLQAEDASRPGNSRLDVDSSADLFVGGVPDGYRVSPPPRPHTHTHSEKSDTGRMHRTGQTVKRVFFFNPGCDVKILVILGLQLPYGIYSTMFKGCVGEVYLDNNHVGMYNFRDLQGQCTACAKV